VRTRRARWAFATASILFLIAAVASLAAGREATAPFLVLGLAFLVIAMGIGRASRQ